MKDQTTPETGIEVRSCWVRYPLSDSSPLDLIHCTEITTHLCDPLEFILLPSVCLLHLDSAVVKSNGDNILHILDQLYNLQYFCMKANQETTSVGEYHDKFHIFSFPGLIWSRYSMVITPKNYSLFAVNIFVALTGLFQLGRIYNYQQSLKQAKSN